MKVTKFGIVLSTFILVGAVTIAVASKTTETNNREATKITYETEVYQAYLDINTTEDKANDKETTKAEKPQTEKTTAKEVATTKPKETTTKQNNDKIVGSLDFGSDDALMLHKIAIAEAGGESVESMALVMLVVLNRTYDSRFPNSIYGVIHQNKQFTPVANGSYAKAQPNEKSQKAMELVINGWDESQGALYFESCSGSSWHSRNLTYLFEKDGHRYYK